MLGFWLSLSAQDTGSYKKVNSSWVNKVQKVYPIDRAAYDLTKSLPKGYSKKGDVDYTKYLQNAIDKYSSVVFPAFPVLINNKGLRIPSNRSIYFKPNSLLIFSGPALGRTYDVIKIIDSKNVSIYNANIKGSKFSKASQSGEFSAGILIAGANNVKIFGGKIFETWGDGITVSYSKGVTSSNVLVENLWIDNVRRNGISVVSANQAKFENILITNTFGTDPQAGVDVEPSNIDCVVKNVEFHHLYTYNNFKWAFQVGLSELNSDERKHKDNVSLLVDNFTDYGGKRVAGVRLNYFRRKNTPSGSVIFKNINAENVESLIHVMDDLKKVNSNIKVDFQNIKRGR